jgi:hydroxyacyl-ACP dehydratase HTD2-like protein with hotdog domain
MTAQYQVGDRLPDLVMTPSALQLFRFSAVTWNAHRVHYDQAWADHEGHAGLLVHSHLHAANALRVLTDGLGADWRIARVSYRIIRPSTADRPLTASAEITHRSDAGDKLQFALIERDDAGQVCLEGSATAVRQ